MIIIPPQDSKKFSQTNSGDFFGNIKQTKNITFDKKGYISLEKRTRLLYDNQTYTNLTSSSTDNIQKIVQNSNRIWVAGTSSLYLLTQSMVLTGDTTASSPLINNNSDICEFPIASGELILIVATDALTGQVYYYDGTWNALSLDINPTKCLCYFENKTSMAAGGGNKVQLITSAKVKSTVLTLPINFSVRSMAWNNLRLYIAGTIVNGEDFGDSIIYEWDGNSAEANYAHKIKGGIAYSYTEI